MARPTILTPETEKAILDAIAIGATDTIAYGAAGIGSSTFHVWIDKGTDHPEVPPSEGNPGRPARHARSPYREFVEKLKIARERFKLNHLANVTQHAQGSTVTTENFGPDGKVVSRTTERKADGDWKASKWLLSVRDPQNYSERVVVENRHTGATGQGPVVVTGSEQLARTVAGYTPDQLRALALGTDGSDLAPEDP